MCNVAYFFNLIIHIISQLSGNLCGCKIILEFSHD